MPKATVDEYYFFPADKSQIGFAGQIAA